MSAIPPHICVSASAEEAARRAADNILARMRETAGRQDRCTLALSGGITPKRVYELLAAPPRREQFPWHAAHFYWGDERCVPPDHLESNFRLAWETILVDAPIDPEQIHRIRGEDPDADHAAAEYDGILPAHLDLLLLGIGEDGHTASLFPGSPALREQDRRVVAVIGPKPPPQRITITPPVILAARHVLVLATGAAKTDAVARALLGPPDINAVPAQLARGGDWIIDQEAATSLT